MELKQLIKGNVEFQFYRDSQLWYKTEEGNFLFPVPVADIGNATFAKVEKGLLMMRYIRKYIAVLHEEEPVE
jgi:hypothetical protein